MKIFSATAFLFLFSTISTQALSIYEARRTPVGSLVTVTGIALNGNEFANTRFIDDGTDAICVFDNSVAAINPGDEITVQGFIADYNGLIEITNLTQLTVNSSGNLLPGAKHLFPYEMGEAKESELIKFQNVTIDNAGGFFAASTTYILRDESSTALLFIRNGSPLVGHPVPTGYITVRGICSQYGSDYEIIPRDSSDIIATPFVITTDPVVTNITSSGLDVQWSTNVVASAYIRYGKTPSYELGYLNASGSWNNHFVSISGLMPSDILYIKCYNIYGTDTASAPRIIAATASTSSGTIKTYFNRTVNTTKASPLSNTAIYLNHSFEDTIAAYINRAQASVDVAIYSFTSTNTTQIIQAINDAYTSGKTVRVIYDGNNVLSGIQQLNPGINKIYSPPDDGYYNIMHNKFIVIDANSANGAMVITGSTNFSDGQLNDDANNLVVINDQTLAKAYTMEFNEMWGTSSATPSILSSRFGYYKQDNTPHIFNIGGKLTECYFSPSDNTTNRISKTIQTAASNLYFSLMLCTRNDLANDIVQQKNNGVYTAGILNDTSGIAGSIVYNTLYNALGNELQVYNTASLPGILHHKYMIVDQNSSSDPLVLTGSHNWSTSAQTRNDENTIIIHDSLIANQYYQEFYQRMDDNGLLLSINKKENTANAIMLYPVPCTDVLYINVADESKVHLFELRSITGKLIRQISLEQQNGIMTTADLTNGVYFLQPLNKDWMRPVKFIVQR